MKPEYIVLHHSMTKDQDVVDWQAIRKYHIGHNGWSAIGYHYGLDLIKDEYEILIGRMPDVQGAHCLPQGYNSKSIGVCLIGNFDDYDVPDEQWELGLKLVKYLCKSNGILIHHVVGHREVAMDGRSCPGGQFDLDKFRSDLASI